MTLRMTRLTENVQKILTVKGYQGQTVQNPIV